MRLGDCTKIKSQVETIDGWMSDGVTGELFKRRSLSWLADPRDAFIYKIQMNGLPE
ncbi:hypothetical protein N836_17695 [Leptolyngbya sp. Heron Island J]|nr:hypothetical protein N836_17695 [Leptolyngbya sp. Heron Island J]